MAVLLIFIRESIKMVDCFFKRFLLISMFIFYSVPENKAAGLQVSPVFIDLVAPVAAGKLTVRNSGKAIANVQVRVLKWTQINGEEKLEPTKDVIASPPVIALDPGVDYLVRVVRVAKAPLVKEEAYRLYIDEIPSIKDQRSGRVSFVVRHSIPLFFSSGEVGPLSVLWNVEKNGKYVFLTGTNNGVKRVKVVAPKVSQGSAVASFANGLLGYIHPGMSMRWRAASVKGNFVSGAAASVSGKFDQLVFNNPASVSGK